MIESNPFVGPRAFEEKDKDFFFGRDREARQLTSLLVGQRIVLFYAQSGSGKTSLLQAGLIPRLKAQQEVAILPITRVGGDLPPNIDTAEVANIYVFNILMSLFGKQTDPHELAQKSLTEGLQHLFSEQSNGYHLQPQVLIIDQFEELYSTRPDRYRDRAGFFQQLRESLSDYAQLILLLSMREDYIAHLDSYASYLPDRLRTRFRMELLDHDKAVDAVMKPAELVGRFFEEQAAESLVKNLRKVQSGHLLPEISDETPVYGPYVEPVYLQIVCQQIWKEVFQDPARDRIRETDVRQYGDVDTVLQDYYDDAVGKVLDEVNISERRLRIWIEENFITSGRTRNLVYFDSRKQEAAGLPQEILEVLRDEYVIRADQRGNNLWYELTHDRLIDPVLAANEAWQRRNYNPLADPTRIWIESNHASSNLLTGQQLRDVQDYYDKHSEDFEDEEKKFLERSFQQNRQRRRLQTLVLIFATFISIIIVTLLVLYINSINSNVAEKEKRVQTVSRINISLDLATLAQTQLEIGNRDQALQLALEANTYPEISLPLVERSLVDVAYPPGTIRLMAEHNRPVKSVAFSPDGSYVISGSDDQTLRLWDTATGAQLRIFEVGEGGVQSVAFSPNGKWVVAGSQDSALTLWDIANGQQVRSFEGHTKSVDSVVFSPDGQSVLSGSQDHTMRLWDVATGAQLQIFDKNPSPVSAVAFSPDGKLILMGSANKVIWLLDVATGELLQSFEGHQDGITTVAFSPDGQYVLSSSMDGTVRLWNVMSGEPVENFDFDAGESILSAGFSPDGTRILAALFGSSLRLLNSATGEEIARLDGHWNTVSSVAFHPTDPFMAVSGSFDTDVRLWDLKWGAAVEQIRDKDGTLWRIAYDFNSQTVLVAGAEPGLLLLNFDEESADFGREISRLAETQTVRDVVFSPDGKRALSVNLDGAVFLWNMQTYEGSRIPARDDIEFSSAAFSPDGALALFGAKNGTLVLWDIENGVSIPREFAGHTESPFNFVQQIAFSPDGHQALTGSELGEVFLWDIQSGQPVKGQVLVQPVKSVAFSHDGKKFLAATGRLSLDGSSTPGIIQLWDIESGEELIQILGHEHLVSSAVFSPDDRTVVSASYDSSVILWDITTGEEIRRFDWHSAWVESVVFVQPYSTRILSGGCAEVRCERVCMCVGQELILWQIDTLEELINWTYQNRYVPEDGSS